MKGEFYQVQWKVQRAWRTGPSFNTEAEAIEYAELRKRGPAAQYRVFDLRNCRPMTKDEVILLLNIAHTEVRFWRTKVSRYMKTGKKNLLDRTDEDYAKLDAIGQETSLPIFHKLDIKTLRELLTDAEDWRQQARARYASDECEIDDDAKVSIGDGGAFVQAWLWVPSATAQEN